MRAIVRQIVNAPYRGIIKKLYLQGKVLELLAMQLDPIAAEFNCSIARSKLKPQTRDRIYQAKDILALVILGKKQLIILFVALSL